MDSSLIKYLLGYGNEARLALSVLAELSLGAVDAAARLVVAEALGKGLSKHRPDIGHCHYKNNYEDHKGSYSVRTLLAGHSVVLKED